MAELEPISFLASLPPIQSAMSVSGNHNGMRMKIDIPETEVPIAIKAMLFAEKLIRVTIEVAEEDGETKAYRRFD